MADDGSRDDDVHGWRALVFRRRGALLAIPAALLPIFGRASPRGIALGLPLAFAGEALRCWAVGYSGVTTRGDVVTAPALTTAGPYAHVRNPLYLGNFLTAAGFTLAFTGGLDWRRRALFSVFGLGSMAAVYATIVPLEEAYLRRTFGADFADYTALVPRLVPRLSPARPARGTYDAKTIVRAETRTFVTFGLMLAALALRAQFD